MSEKTQIIGRKFVFDFGDDAKYELNFVAEDKLEVTVVADSSYPAGTLNKFDITRTQLRPDLYLVTWVEDDTGNTVTHVQDYANLTAYTSITDLASRGFWNLRGRIIPVTGQ
ncbi:MoaF-related domain-containing protein [Pseudarthrobacter albicanus]|uniref:MoaF-related domain-containing protein n=1 Tax=Pseudarthrobacter albicanus TaxID=2823873 RepID=UPI001BAA293C|nr:MoaF N-terminal domain-containing protein [Pseudarthrobacter albicanus]